MEEEYKVSLWAGSFICPEDFDNYIRETYDDDGNMALPFTEWAGLEYYDAGSVEALFDASGELHAVFSRFSYSESFLEKIPFAGLSGCNSFLLLYNFNYANIAVSPGPLHFIGSFDYQL